MQTIMKRALLPAVCAVFTAALFQTCGGSSPVVDLEPRDQFGRKIERGLPDLAETMPPGMAKVKSRVIRASEKGSTLFCTVKIIDVEAVSDSAPPLKNGKIVELHMPKIAWLRFDSMNRTMPPESEQLRVSMQYAGKPADSLASTAWRLKRLFK